MERGPAKASPPKAASPAAFSDQNMENDDGDVTSSRYSSCGESEFERYCSANSAMGTPSVCSSTLTVFNDLSEAEFGGSTSSLGLGLGFGDEGGGLESFSLGGKAERSCREETRRLSDESGVPGRESGLNFGSSGFELYGGDEGLGFSSEGVDHGLMAWKVESGALPLQGVSKFGDDGVSDKGGGSGDDEEECGAFERISDRGSNRLELDRVVVKGSRVLAEDEECHLDLVGGGEGHGSDGDEEEMEGEGGDGGSSRDEHLEGEDSMYNYGSDGEGKKVEFIYYGNADCPVEAKPGDENPLLMNSAVAFGSDDWDDFAQESGGIGLPSVSFSSNALKNQDGKIVEGQTGVSDSTTVNSIRFANTSLSEKAKVVADKHVAVNHVEGADNVDGFVDISVARAGFPKTDESEEADDVKDIPVASYQVHRGSDVIEFTKNTFSFPTFAKVQNLEKEETDYIPHVKNQARGGDDLADYSKNFSVDNVGLEPLDQEFDAKLGFYNGYDGTAQAPRNTITEEAVNVSNSRVSENPGRASRDLKIKYDNIYTQSTNQPSSHSTVSSRNMRINLLEESKPKTEEPSTLKKNLHLSMAHDGNNTAQIKTDVLGVNDFHNEVVHEMEEILLASNESPGARFPHSNRVLQSQQSLPMRDGGLSASTSGTYDAYPFARQPLRIDGIEVVGARQKKGDVSFGERLVGVKEYTVYKIRVLSGNDQWEVERRYRDFCTLHRRLKTLFSSQGWVLPASWATVEKESRKIFGNASPDVVSERSVLIQESLRSILPPRFFTTSPSALIWFLSPQDSFPNSPASNTSDPQYNSLGNLDNMSTLGKTISLIVEIQPYKSVKQMLEAQHYTCAGCYKHFDDGKTLIHDFALTFGWGKPRLCEYTSQLFCSSCHTNETAVLPARVLHNWDFTQYPVSQMAKSYLDSIHDQPMLCVSAVNPFLFSKVQTLLHVMGVRKKIGSILSYVRCSFRGSINRGLGSRRYLLESNDFFALRDLIDLSKGAFAVLPVMVENVLKKIVDHITEQCLVCCDVGIPCSARRACNDPSALIFPFQEGDVEKCPSCESVFHKACFRKLTDCHCGAHLRVGGETMGLTRRLNSGALDFLEKGLGSSLGSGFLSGLFSKAKPESSLGDHRDNNNVILMGFLPSSSL